MNKSLRKTNKPGARRGIASLRDRRSKRAPQITYRRKPK